MQLVKGLLIVAVLCMAQVSAGNAEHQTGKQTEIKDESKLSDSDDAAPSPVQQGFNVQQVKFSAGDPKEEEGEDESPNHTPLIAAVAACACMGVLGVIYIKRRKHEEKLGGEIFTIDDKNSVL